MQNRGLDTHWINFKEWAEQRIKFTGLKSGTEGLAAAGLLQGSDQQDYFFFQADLSFCQVFLAGLLY